MQTIRLCQGRGITSVIILLNGLGRVVLRARDHEDVRRGKGTSRTFGGLNSHTFGGMGTGILVIVGPPELYRISQS